MSFTRRMEAWRDVLQRYRETFKFHWAQREAMKMPRLTADEAEFMPGALAVQHRPVSPSARWVARILIGMLVTLLLWAVLSQVDVVVNAQGKLIATERTKVISTGDTATVRRLLVQEGDSVRAGDVLLELDARVWQSEREKAGGETLFAQLQIARSLALLHALDRGRVPLMLLPVGMPAERGAQEQAHLMDEWRDFVARRDRLDSDLQRLEQALQLAERTARDYAVLVASGDVAEHAWIERERARVDLHGQVVDTRRQQSILSAELRRDAQRALGEARRLIDTSTQDSRRAEVQADLLTLTAPIDGTVQGLGVHTVGAAVPAAQALMNIVPNHGPWEIEAFVENRDVGFIEEGQEAAVKIDAYEYTRYGTIPARVSQTSRDAIQDEKRGPIFKVKVTLSRDTVQVNGQDQPLRPGMSGTVEIKTGTRRVVEYVLSPLIQHAKESIRER